jgi:hypothetical protein
MLKVMVMLMLMVSAMQSTCSQPQRVPENRVVQPKSASLLAPPTFAIALGDLF